MVLLRELRLELQPYRLFPYERALARREVTAIGLSPIEEDVRGLVAEGNAQPEALRRLTYFREVVDGERCVTPYLAQLEERHREGRKGGPRPRQATRYLVHGLHEYKGKFNPQVVRAFCNILGFAPGDLLIDPFCGSGTSLVEALCLGGCAAGVDLSPLAVLVSRAKVAALAHPNPDRLARRLEAWSAAVAHGMHEAQESGKEDPRGFERLSQDAVRYLRSWFTPPAAAALSVGLRYLGDLHDEALFLVAAVTLSSILRDVSLQRPEDLRVRRRPYEFVAPSLAVALRAAALNSIRSLEETSRVLRPPGRARVEQASAASPGALQALRGDAGRALVVTSPPYATALPYVDTDRLSLVALGLARPAELRRLEADLIGSREWDGDEERRWFRALDADDAPLPGPVLALCREIRSGNGTAVGFRRRALPGLLYRYFTLMSHTFEQLRGALREGERAVLIVGYNRTRAAHRQITIETPTLLGLVAETRGFLVEELLPLETWPRYGLHHENGVRGEAAVILRATR